MWELIEVDAVTEPALRERCEARAGARILPPHRPGPDVEQPATLAAGHGIEVLGPPGSLP